VTLQLKTPLLRRGHCAWCGRDRQPLTYGCCSEYCRMKAGPVAFEGPDRGRATWRKYYKPAPLLARACVGCRIGFMPLVANQKHCNTCIDKRLAPKDCPECGTSFDPRTPGQKYCGFICQGEAARRYGKERWQREQRAAADRVDEAMRRQP
jgi:hypothetical protein